MGKLLIHGGILKATPTKHLEPGAQHRCRLLSRISTWDKAGRDAGVLSTITDPQLSLGTAAGLVLGKPVPLHCCSPTLAHRDSHGACPFAGGLDGGCSQAPPAHPSTYGGAFTPSSRSLVMEAARRRKSGSGLTQDTEPTTLTQLTACGWHSWSAGC